MSQNTRLEGDKLALLVDHVQQVSGLNAERRDELLGGVDAPRDLLRRPVDVDRDQPLGGAQALGAFGGEGDLIAGGEVAVLLVGELEDQHFVLADTGDVAKLRLGDRRSTPFIAALVEGKPEDAVAAESLEGLAAVLAEIDRLAEPDRAGAVAETLNEDVLVGWIEAGGRKDLPSVRHRVSEREDTVIYRGIVGFRRSTLLFHLVLPEKSGPLFQ